MSIAKAVVRIPLSGSRYEDRHRARNAFRAMLGSSEWEQPPGWIWHHLADGTTLQLVPLALHGGLPHTGSFTETSDPGVRALRTPSSPLPLTSTHRPLAPALLERVEDVLGTRLPEPYRAFLLRWNGGHPRVTAFRGAETGDESLGAFLGIAPGQDGDLTAFLSRYETRLPDGFVPIAYDAFGNLILIAVSGPETGAIIFWDHEREDQPKAALRRVAPGLDAFLGMFYED